MVVASTRPASTLEWTPCGQAECATLTVPLDHDDPSSGSIDLKVARRLARRPEERRGVLLFNPGGPGVPATPIIINFEGPQNFFSPNLLDRFDVVTWDPRGVSTSTKVDCVDDLNSYLALDPTPETSDEANRILETLGAAAPPYVDCFYRPGHGPAPSCVG